MLCCIHHTISLFINYDLNFRLRFLHLIVFSYKSQGGAPLELETYKIIKDICQKEIRISYLRIDILSIISRRGIFEYLRVFMEFTVPVSRSFTSSLDVNEASILLFVPLNRVTVGQLGVWVNTCMAFTYRTF